MNMSPARIDLLLRRYREDGEEIKRLQARRREIVDQFPVGRTEGTELALFKSRSAYHNSVDISLLTRFVTRELLEKCSVQRYKRGSAKLVPKAKPRGRKNAEKSA